MGRCRVTVTADRATAGLLPEPAHFRLAVRDGVLGGQVPVGEHLGVVLDTLSDQQRVGAAFGPRVGVIECPHLLGGAQVIAFAAEPEPGRVVNLGVCSHA